MKKNWKKAEQIKPHWKEFNLHCVSDTFEKFRRESEERKKVIFYG